MFKISILKVSKLFFVIKINTFFFEYFTSYFNTYVVKPGDINVLLVQWQIRNSTYPFKLNFLSLPLSSSLLFSTSLIGRLNAREKVKLFDSWGLVKLVTANFIGWKDSTNYYLSHFWLVCWVKLTQKMRFWLIAANVESSRLI